MTTITAQKSSLLRRAHNELLWSYTWTASNCVCVSTAVCLGVMRVTGGTMSVIISWHIVSCDIRNVLYMEYFISHTIPTHTDCILK